MHNKHKIVNALAGTLSAISAIIISLKDASLVLASITAVLSALINLAHALSGNAKHGD